MDAPTCVLSNRDADMFNWRRYRRSSLSRPIAILAVATLLAYQVLQVRSWEGAANYADYECNRALCRIALDPSRASATGDYIVCSRLHVGLEACVKRDARHIVRSATSSGQLDQAEKMHSSAGLM